MLAGSGLQQLWVLCEMTICMEEFDGKERHQKLHRALPEGVRSIRTTLIYKKVEGYPQPRVKYTASSEQGGAKIPSLWHVGCRCEDRVG